MRSISAREHPQASAGQLGSPLRGLLPAEEDEQTRQAVLASVIDAFPKQFTIRELALMLANDLMDDSVERAVRDLVGAGLLRCKGCMVLPTRVTMPELAIPEREGAR